MAAQLDLSGGREPAEVVVAVANLDEEGCLRMVHLHRDLLAEIIWHRGIQDANSRRVPMEWAVREGVNNVDGLRHLAILSQLLSWQGIQLPLLGDQLTQIIFIDFLLGVRHLEELVVEMLEAIGVEVEAHLVEPEL